MFPCCAHNPDEAKYQLLYMAAQNAANRTGKTYRITLDGTVEEYHAGDAYREIIMPSGTTK